MVGETKPISLCYCFAGDSEELCRHYVSFLGHDENTESLLSMASQEATVELRLRQNLQTLLATFPNHIQQLKDDLSRASLALASR